jgi:hypothetical protein
VEDTTWSNISRNSTSWSDIARSAVSYSEKGSMSSSSISGPVGFDSSSNFDEAECTFDGFQRTSIFSSPKETTSWS